ncbi:transcription factor bHLH155-like [Gastrolobium bilobum]|uniref:transcription factor bHLH155-like n=1 Tax=Gastrolobium bilobum TaxID=150636 RepID=UPI002AAF3488|nr:transcription factor bHLH155-like [Gastrolobium bilobum]
MEATSITQLLKGFCDNTQWEYAFFWKLSHHFPMTLTWENGYQKRNEAVESIWGDINFKSPDDVYSSSGESTDDSGDYSARLLMNEMSHLKYCLGEGVVGKVALAEDHCWVFCEDMLTNKFDTDLIPECPDEWLLQFASGIKTIVLVPVLPQGVLQFGSFEAVAEDMKLVTNIKEKFHSIHCMEANTTPLNMGTDDQDWSFSALTHNLMHCLDESSSIANSVLKGEVSASTALNAKGSTRLNPTMISFIQDECSMSGKNQQKSLKRANENETSSSSIEMSIDPRHIGQMETNANHMEEEIWTMSHSVNNDGVFGEMSNGLGSCFGKNMTQQQFGGIETCHDDTNWKDFFTFPSESELHKALGSVAFEQTGNSMSHTNSSSTLNFNRKGHDYIKGMEFPKEADPENLLDAVISNLCSASDDTSSISNSIRSPMIEFTGFIRPKVNFEESSLIVNARSDIMPAVMVKGRDEVTNRFTSTSFDGNSSLLFDEEWQEKIDSHMQPIRGPKLSSTSKKRARVGNSQNSRPRDRQMIMDRMKELRELVPDGGKGSIDNLLERTIKHMMYLRKITSQAEKLKQFSHCEVSECKKQKINGGHPGRTCAFDFDNELALPIVIEDLECPGHMLIKMICNEHGLFLEIAQVIRKLDLTILKGTLENHPSTSWACFIVEVPRGFHRMDVLWHLLHLPQLRRNLISCKS